MSTKRKIIIGIAAVLVVLLLGLELLSPVFRGEVALSLPERIRSLFSWMDDDQPAEEETLPEEIVLEEQPEMGAETPMRTDGEWVALPDDGDDAPTKPTQPTQGENQLPMDEFHK